jgi:hypothetical protein
MNWKATTPTETTKEETMKEFKEYGIGGEEISQEALDIAEKHLSPVFTSGLNGTTAEDIVGTYADKVKPKRKSIVIPKVKVDVVNQPPHYTTGGIETIDFIEAKLSHEEYIGYLKGNVLKYASRLGHKGDAVTDAGKLNWYTTRLARALGGE